MVHNFEKLDPANTLWSKQYKLYAEVDTEAQRYLDFEKYWGGYVFLEGSEMQYIADNLFIGNKLATAELMTSDGVRIDLRNVRSPIVVFSSYGDNITPPPQALGWITDLYRDDADVIAHDQTIVYATHDSIGHLGIFVSGSVGRKEYREFADNIDLIDLLPAGIYHAEVEEKGEAAEVAQGDPHDPYRMKIRRSGVEDVRAIVQPDPDSDRRFAAAACVSEINLALYRNIAQPWVQALSSPLTARWLQTLHPLRMGFECWSDQHPLAPLLAHTAEQVRAQRQPVSADNPFLQVQHQLSEAIEYMLDCYRDHRDAIYAMAFDTLYGSPAIQALAGQNVSDARAIRPHPGDSPEHCAYLANELAQLEAGILEGGLPEAFVRGLTWIFQARGETDDRLFHHAWNLLLPHIQQSGNRSEVMATFRALVRRQALLIQRDPDAALAAIPHLLADTSAQTRRDVVALIGDVFAHESQLSKHEQSELKRIVALFSVDDATPTPAPPIPELKAGAAEQRNSGRKTHGKSLNA